ncbi:MAG: DNA-directed RNA polymerase [Candidatus Marsarchaeota archaeon]|jgi:DNA-directed RNA polymerase subunit E'
MRTALLPSHPRTIRDVTHKKDPKNSQEHAMFYLYKVSDLVRVPAAFFGNPVEDAVALALKEKYAGKVISEDVGIVLQVLDVQASEEGKVPIGQGATYHEAVFSLLAYRPLEREIVEGEVVAVEDYGIHVRIGPIEGVAHQSQLMDDYVDYDARGGRYVGRNTKRTIERGDLVRARIITVSIHEGDASDVKVNLTMRQPGLGNLQWLEEDRKKQAEKIKGEKP